MHCIESDLANFHCSALIQCMISTEKFLQIQDELRLIEEEEKITVLWACESGSRAWGFASQDSDYDVRFIYLRQTKDYLRASSLRDVIEKPISDDLDISGWDLPKALGLFRKSNPPLLEWLQSPIVYSRNDTFHSALSALIPDYFSPIGCMYHYMSMADRNRRSYLDKEEIKLKRYFYMLRPVLACMWIDRGFGTPPIEFGKMLDRLLPEGELRTEIEALKERKKQGDELDLAAPIPIISEFIKEQMEKFIEATKETQFTKEWEPLDALFRNILVLVNGARIEENGGSALGD
jgi:predicted nucleotidyltransferase